MTQNKGLQSEGLTVVLNTKKNDIEMSNRFFKILIYLILFATSVGYSQNIPWTVQETSIPKDITVNIQQSLFEGDTLLIGAFYGSTKGEAKCGGYARIPGDPILRTYGKDAYYDGFEQGEQYQFRVYSLKKGCYMVVKPYNTYTFGNQSYLDDSSITLSLAKVVYPQTTSCRSKEELFPIIYEDSLFPMTFSSTNGLAIDYLTGTINTEKSRAGVYGVKVNTESCLASVDSILITEGDRIFQSQDTVFCNGVVQIGTNQSAESYTWSTGESSSFINATKSGTYILTLKESNGCLTEDTISVRILNPLILLGSDTTICSSSYTLIAPVGYNYMWNTNSTDRSIAINYSGKYWLDLNDGAYCTISDTINITLKEPIQFDLGKDTSGICSVPYELKGPSGYNYSWNTGETSESIKVTQPGKYTLNVSDGNGCKTEDSILLDFSLADIPQVNLGPDTVVCAASFILNAGKSGSLYKWSTNESGDFIEVKTSGRYCVTVTDKNGCRNFDSIDVELRDGFNAGNISVEIINPPCDENINVTLVPDSLSGIYPYTYSLIKNGVVVGTNAIGVFDNVHEGSYNFEIKDARGCKASGTNEMISVRKTEPCPDNVLAFTPASQATYFIGFPGLTKIYDMAGILIKTIPTPAEWDGTGNNGEVVPMGDYIIVCGENQKIIVTVIK